MKYPRIPHLLFSNPFNDDFFMDDDYRGRWWVVTEKIDGSQISIEFDGELIAIYNRNTQLLCGKMDKQFHILPKWLSYHMKELNDLLKDRYILFGDWMFHQHTIRYTRLPDWFIGYGMYSKEDKEFLRFYKAKGLIEGAKIYFVPVIYDGIINSEEQILSFIKQSQFSEEEMEGVVLHSIDGKDRCKYVTKKFRGSIDNNEHWRVCKRVKNTLYNEG